MKLYILEVFNKNAETHSLNLWMDSIPTIIQEVKINKIYAVRNFPENYIRLTDFIEEYKIANEDPTHKVLSFFLDCYEVKILDNKKVDDGLVTYAQKIKIVRRIDRDILKKEYNMHNI